MAAGNAQSSRHPSRVIAIGHGIYCGQGHQAALQVRPQDRWTALLLLSPLEESR
ncbi:hypothetical protein [Microcystis sp. LEGE 08355]|uniref:hypothetical protein n=1 Tax=Microcystis sp. LEGE 08355 TaxID=1828687 RepID=UPI00187E9775|nr:hypothetical protein [Microcystis sp. LEGE 08355]MBE9074246.1 hypothetical protein [Microcystis sp. LEGE 08355]